MQMLKVDELNGKRVLILGLARQGVAMARFASEVGAKVFVSDLRSEEQLQMSLDTLANLPLELALGGHPLGLLEGTDVVVVSGGVPLDIPIIVEANRLGIAVTNDSLEFLKRAPCPVIGITGSAGKTTTTALTGAMSKSAGRKTWIGGNIGRPLITELEQMSRDDLVVQELSSFQLELWTESPPIAAILNITPNHLDRHTDMEAYIRAKANIVDHQSSDGIAVLSHDDPVASSLSERAAGRLRYFSKNQPIDDGAFIDGDVIVIRNGDQQRNVCSLADISLRGEHNVLNVLAAVTLADSAGIPAAVMQEAIVHFRGVPHRLEEVAVINGVTYINDSIATAPERAIAALQSFSEPIVLLAGGRDKNMRWTDWAQNTVARTRAVILFGDLGEYLESLILRTLDQEGADDFQLVRASSLEEAVKASSEIARPGDVVLLAPGGTSFDSFVDFEARGEAFRKLVFGLARRPQENSNFMLN